MSYSRVAKQTPWYHAPLPRCDAITLQKEQCIYSARFTAVDGRDIKLCKTHADMADFPLKPIRARNINLR